MSAVAHRVAPLAVVVDAFDENAGACYEQFGFHPLDELRRWRRMSDEAVVPGVSAVVEQ